MARVSPDRERCAMSAGAGIRAWRIATDRPDRLRETHGAHRAEIRRHLGRRYRADPATPRCASSARSMPATRSRSSSRRWPARPISSSTGPAQISRLHDAREYDVVVASGEQVTAGLMALALQDLGVNARSWLGWQIPIRTDGVHGKARIETIDDRRDRAPLRRGPGRGRRRVSRGSGRAGASRRSAAAAPIPRRSRSRRRCKADRCDIFTDVDGVYTTDPRIVAKARKLE